MCTEDNCNGLIRQTTHPTYYFDNYSISNERDKTSLRVVDMDYPFDNQYSVREITAIPYASSLIEGHRDFGYSLETALADVIDNSITANASHINLETETSSERPYIAIADNGHGMSETELIEAMRLGSKDPRNLRDAQDLGRFGLGLKSASFSQCRRLTVITRNTSGISCACWDLDLISDHGNWTLMLINSPDKLPGFHLLEKTGTVVVWEKLDRLVDGFGQDDVKRSQFLNAELARAEQHLRLVFHRFMEGYKPQVTIFLNSRKIKHIDPMASNHPSTQRDPEETLRLEKGTVRFRCFTLPHHKKMSKDEWDEIGGQEGHLKSQGLYIYRENRLIIAGSWLGLARQKELTKLCRVAVDIPNTMDSDWKIDVKKASAQLPPLVKERLKRVVERLVGTSKKTYISRGQKLVEAENHPLWNRIQKEGQVIFRPNYDHPVFINYSEQLPEELKRDFFSCLKLIGAGLPIDTLHAELVGNSELVTQDTLEEADLKKLVSSLSETLLSNGLSQEALSDVLQGHPLLKAHWQKTMEILENILKGEEE